MTVRPILTLGDARLRLVGQPVDSFGKYLHELLDDLAHTMRAAPGVGLAAPQIGEALQACVIEVEGQLHELVNPRIVRASGDDRDLEGCLSIPGYVAYVTRREKVWVVAQNRHGRPIKSMGSGLLARAMQHELDHLAGKLYIDYLESFDELIAVGRGRARTRPASRVGDGRPGLTTTPWHASRTVFFGSGTFALPALARLADGVSPGAALVDLAAVVTAPPRPAGRRGELRPTPVALAAEARGIPVLTPVSLRRDEVLSELRALGADLVVLADYGRLIPAALLDLPRHGALNLHPSLLPRHRGAAPVPAAILAGDAVTGVTLMRMDEGLDTRAHPGPARGPARRHGDRP